MGTARHHDIAVSLPVYPVPDGPIARPNVRVATILDTFSTLAFGYEWDQHPVMRLGWQEQLESLEPDLLFVESAWAGNDRSWRLTMTNPKGPHADLRQVVRWCQERGIPTVFWNKEDPPNYGVFIRTAALFDHVFTVDADRIPTYREDLGHERVSLLPFAAQPRIHSPVRFPRPAGAADLSSTVAFAGTYFAHKHPERRAQMDFLLPAARDRGLHIFSRMQSEDERYQFPDGYKKCVVGSVPYPQMLSAATAYPVFLNVNSVTQSPTMCARRLFELSAAQTAVLSAPSAAIKPFFGDTVTVVSNADEARGALGVLLDQEEHRDRMALLAHRRVFDEHLYRHRVDTILGAVGVPVTEPDRSISAIVPTMRPENVDHVLRTIATQVHDDLELVLVTHGFNLAGDDLRRRADVAGLARVTVVAASADLTLGACMNLGVDAASGRYVAKMDDDNTYSPHYLSDLVRAFSYSEAQVVGKWAHYVHLASSNAMVLRFAHAEHRYVRLVQGGTIVTTRDLALTLRFEDLPRRVDTTFLDKVRADSGKVYSADRFNYVSRRSSSTAGHTWGITDQDLLNRGSRIVSYGEGSDLVTV
ncbi:MAG: glycosyltransferase [Ornithinimicrobium sp.]